MLRRASEFIAQKAGLYFPPERYSDLQRGLASAAVEFGFADSARCVDWLLSAPLSESQLHKLVSHLTVGETYFLRERKTLDALVEHVLPDLIRRGKRRLRLWSAACSTGEEPYSLAILVQQLLPDWRNWDLTILATDINAHALQKAAAGVYGEWSFREAPPEFKERFFTRTPEGRFAIAAEIRNCVHFAPLNLAQDYWPALVTGANAMDIILCRNLLMYFSAPQARKLVENFLATLTDEGWLAVSPSECSQATFSQFVTVNFPGSILYRKRRAGSPSISTLTPFSASAEHAAPALEAQQPSSEPLSVESHPNTTQEVCASTPSDPEDSSQPYAAAAALYQQGRYAESATILLRELAQDDEQTPTKSTRAACSSRELSLLTRALANQGRLAAALIWGRRWISADKIDPSAYYLYAMVQQELGEREAARRSLQRAIYLRPDFALAYFALGNLARAESRAAEANKHFTNALSLLRSCPPDALLPESEGTTAGRLAEIIDTLLALPQQPLTAPRY